LSAPKRRQSDFEFIQEIFKKQSIFSRNVNKTTQGRLSVASNGMMFATERTANGVARVRALGEAAKQFRAIRPASAPEMAARYRFIPSRSDVF
jgi:hypothetical protein